MMNATEREREREREMRISLHQAVKDLPVNMEVVWPGTWDQDFVGSCPGSGNAPSSSKKTLPQVQSLSSLIRETPPKG